MRANRLFAIATLVAVLIVFTGALVGCVGDGKPRPHDGVRKFWTDYEKLARVKAIALAGDPNHRWVAGASGGEPTWEAAEAAAMAECNQRRRLRRITDPCRMYARGNKIVWPVPR
jgi:hypothetical protein